MGIPPCDSWCFYQLPNKETASDLFKKETNLFAAEGKMKTGNEFRHCEYKGFQHFILVQQ
jgi:hypothetical protein